MFNACYLYRRHVTKSRISKNTRGSWYSSIQGHHRAREAHHWTSESSSSSSCRL